MARYNPNSMQIDDGEFAPKSPTTTAAATPMSNADIRTAVIAATQETSLTPYTELTPAERSAMSQAERLAYLKAARDEQDVIASEKRALSNPMFDYTNRPAAPGSDRNYIFYYSWLGDTKNGEWKLFRAPNTQENQAKYGSRTVGGVTQANPGNPQGANSLTRQPQPIRDAYGQITGWSVDGDVTTTPPPGNPPPGNPPPGTPPPGTPPPGNPPPGNPPPGGNTAVDTTGMDATTKALIESLQKQIADLTKTTNTTTTATQYNDRMSVYATMADRFNKYGLTGLANKIKELAMKGASEATITLELMDTQEYQQRFSANADRIKKGLAALTPAEYVNVEDSYRQVLRAYGLKQFDNDAYVKQFIANDMSPTELSNRVVTAVQRVQNADPALINQLKQYYGISSPDMVAYVLDPQQQFQKIERQIAASEIGVAAGRQGLTAGVSVAEQLAAQGVSEAEARKGYATIADILPTAEKLSGVYGSTMDTYGQSEGEQEVFNSLASAQRKRQRLSAAEIATFSASAGTNRTSLTSPRAPGQT